MSGGCAGCGKSRSGHEVGVNVPGVYDGVLFWMCSCCGRVRHRWPEGSILREKAEEHAPVSAS